jgi:hypothetical protein
MADKTGRDERERRKAVQHRLRKFFAALRSDLMHGVDVDHLWARVEAKQQNPREQ